MLDSLLTMLMARNAETPAGEMAASEPAGGVEDIHLHPVEPRQLRASLRLLF